MLVVREGVAWIAAGLATGGLAARALTRYLESLLFNVTATDAATFIAVAMTLGAIALVATAWPADACAPIRVIVTIGVHTSGRGSSVGRAYD